MEGNGHKSEAPSTTLTLMITLDQLTGAVNVNGPIQNAIVCYGMLESAKYAIQKHIEQLASGQRILPATAVPFLKQ